MSNTTKAAKIGEDAVKGFLANPNVAYYVASGTALPSLANALASDYLRKLGTLERVGAMRFLQRKYPQLATAVVAVYPQHAE